MHDGGDDLLAAGDFSPWLDGLLAARRGEGDSDVPCGSCTACCTSSQFVTIAPDELDALACIPVELRFPAPGAPAGHVVVGYDERGHCPMLVDGSCSIYAHRPRACRAYDCRVFAATGVEVDEESKRLIAERVRRWRFDHPRPADRVNHDAVRAAATYLRARRGELPAGVVPTASTPLAVLAVAVHDVFLPGAEPEIDEVRVAVERVTLRPPER